MKESETHRKFISLLRGEISESESRWHIGLSDKTLYKQINKQDDMQQMLEKKFDELFGNLEDAKKT